MKRAIYPGSFDPVTLGHLNIIKRAAAMFDELIVCVSVNSSKSAGLFTPEERVELIRKVTEDIPNVRVDCSRELLAAYVRQHPELLKPPKEGETALDPATAKDTEL